METLGYLVLRLFFGAIFLLHGFQQMGWLDGSGLQGPVRTIERTGFRPVWLWARCLAYGTLTGGLSLLLGALTSVGSALLVTIMVIAIITSKTGKGFWNRDGGYEYNLSLIGGSAATGLLGPGVISVDAFFAPHLISAELFVVLTMICLAFASVGFMTRQVVQQPAQH
jgi:putative oxidoreductase